MSPHVLGPNYSSETARVGMLILGDVDPDLVALAPSRTILSVDALRGLATAERRARSPELASLLDGIALIERERTVEGAIDLTVALCPKAALGALLADPSPEACSLTRHLLNAAVGGSDCVAIVAGYVFEDSPEDVALLGALGRVGRVALAPVLAGAGMSHVDGPEGAPAIPSDRLEALRRREEARFIALVGPRLRVGSGWVTAAFALAACIASASSARSWPFGILGPEAAACAPKGAASSPVVALEAELAPRARELIARVAVARRREDGALWFSSASTMLHRDAPGAWAADSEGGCAVLGAQLPAVFLLTLAACVIRRRLLEIDVHGVDEPRWIQQLDDEVQMRVAGAYVSTNNAALRPFRKLVLSRVRGAPGRVTVRLLCTLHPTLFDPKAHPGWRPMISMQVELDPRLPEEA